MILVYDLRGLLKDLFRICRMNVNIKCSIQSIIGKNNKGEVLKGHPLK